MLFSKRAGVNKRAKYLGILLLLVLAGSSVRQAYGYINLPKDAEGWTIFTPSADTRILYVSADGDDTTGQYYAPSDPQIGADPFSPAGAINTYATYAAAYAQTRDGYPDWILIKRGDTFYESIGDQIRDGRDEDEPFLIASYGDSGLSPVFKTGASRALERCCRGFSWIAVSGISFYAHTRDPESLEYVSGDGSVGIRLYSDTLGQGLLIEGCKLRYYEGNSITDASNTIYGITFRRNVVLDNYNDSAHSQGLWVARTTGFLIEENIFDHNGWHSQAPATPGTATMFNHNTYTTGNHDMTISGNIFMRPSSMNNKFTGNDGAASCINISVDNNLYIDGEIGISLGGNTIGPDRFKDMSITNNVFTEIGRSRPTNRTLAWGIEIIDWDGGLVSGNYFIHFSNPQSTNIYGINIDGGHKDVVVNNNIIYNLNPHGNSGDDPAIYITYRDTKTNVSVSRNLIQEPANDIRLIEVENSSDLSGFDFYNNAYFTADESIGMHVDGNEMAFDSWAALTTDNSSFSQAEFPEPTRSIETYQASRGATPTIDAFVQAARSQDRYNWNPVYTASVVNAWIKAGFTNTLSYTGSGTLQNVKVYPNPYKPGSGGNYARSGGLIFDGLTQECTIKIFNVSGEQVYEYNKNDSNDRYEWNTLNSSGKEAASGVYLYVITNEAGEKTSRKFVIVR